MKKTVTFLFLFSFISMAFGQAPVIEWQKCYGGFHSETASSLVYLKDSSFLLFGGTTSHDGDVTFNHDTLTFTNDLWITNISADGALLWQKSLGGSGQEIAGEIVQCADGGYVFSATTYSHNGDVSMNHDSTGNTSDVWVAKLNQSGALLWERSFGGTKNDNGNDIIETPDSGFIIVGSTCSHDGNVSFNHDTLLFTSDVWILKINKDGNLLWEKSLGGSGAGGEIANTIISVYGGNYLVTATSGSSDGDCQYFHDNFTPSPNLDSWLIKINSVGDTLWERCFGGTGIEDLTHVVQMKDSSFAVTQRMWGSTDGDVRGNIQDPFNGNIWTFNFKIGIDTIRWQKVSGGPWADRPSDILLKENGSLLVMTYQQNNGLDVAGNHGGWDFWLFELDTAHQFAWKNCFGGQSDELYPQGLLLNDSTFILSGSAGSNNGNISGNHGDFDFWLAKFSYLYPTDIHKNLIGGQMNVFPNPSSGKFILGAEQSFKKSIVTVTDISGKLLFKQSVATAENQFPIDLEQFESGIYIVKIQGESGVSYGKLILEK